MAIRTVQTVLESLNGGSKMFGWDVIIALDGKQLNKTLQQDYLKRLADGTGLGAYSGDFRVPTTDLSNHFGDITLGPVQLDFTGAQLDETGAKIRMAVTGGSHVQLKSDNNIQKAISISVLGAWNSAELSMMWPMSVGLQTLDVNLADCQTPKFTLFSTVNEQQLAGNAFVEWFNTLEHGEQVSTLGAFNYASNRLMQADKMYARMQPGDADEAALVIFGHFPQTGTTGWPAPGGDFPYLIPTNEFSATAMFSRRVIHRGAMGQAVMGALDDGLVEDVNGTSGTFEGIRATRGVLPAGARSLTIKGFEFKHAAFELPAVTGPKALQVTFLEDGALQEWQPAFELPLEYHAVGTDEWVPATATVTLDLRHEFHITADEEEQPEGHVYCPYQHTEEIRALSIGPEVPADVLAEAKHFILLTVKRAILERWFNVLNLREPHAFLDKVALAGDSPVKDFRIAMRSDQALFSEIHPAGAAFSIVEQQPIVGVGKSIRLSTVPAPVGVKWALQALPPDEIVGRINEDTGEYTVPFDTLLEGSYAQVLATATGSDGNKSTTLITVLADEIALSPLVQQCPENSTVKISAAVDNATGLTWATPAHGTLQAIAGDPSSQLYIPGPAVPNKAYVEVDITVTQGDRTGKAFVLVTQAGADAMRVVPDLSDPSTSLPAGKLKVRAWGGVPETDRTDQATWTIGFGGPGVVDKGLYEIEASKKANFVLINATLQGRSGHILLPLPLKSYPTVLQALAR